MFGGLTMYATQYDPPEKRRSSAIGGVEVRLTEAAIMLAFAMHLLSQAGSSGLVHVHPDGEHAKIFDIGAFLARLGFQKSEGLGTTSYGGRYVRGSETVVIRPTPGLGDVLGEVAGRKVIAECKGGVINSTHAGQKSRLRRGMSELIGQLMVLPVDNSRQVAVMPFTGEIARLAQRLAPRCDAAGIEIALVQADGRIDYVKAS
jgi:hypothetical protein